MKSLISFILILLFMLPATPHAESNPPMRVHFIDVGQGDSMLIETPENQFILIDGGEPKAGHRLVAFLKKRQVDEIDLLIATHPDIDHIGGLTEVIKQFPVRQIIDNGQSYGTHTYAAYRMLVFKEKIPVKVAVENESIALEESLEIKVLHASVGENNNQSSIVLKISYDDIDFLLMSDVEAEQEKAIAEKYDIEAEVLKVAHHGSSSSSTLDFLEKANPEAAIISYSKENRYGHPVHRVIKNLEKLQAQIFSTAVYGNIVVETDGKSYIILPEMQPMERLIKSIERQG